VPSHHYPLKRNYCPDNGQKTLDANIEVLLFHVATTAVLTVTAYLLLRETRHWQRVDRRSSRPHNSITAPAWSFRAGVAVLGARSTPHLTSG
jgi:hypothetical protein